MSLAEKLARLTNPEPVFEDPEKDSDITAAKVTEHEADGGDSEYLLGAAERSTLRIRNADLGADSRYKGKKTSRSALARQRGDDLEEEGGDDLREHAAAELGHMFEGGEEKEEPGSEEDSNGEGEEEEDSDGEGKEEEEEDGEEGWEKEEETTQEFSFDKTEDLGKYGDLEEEESNSEESDDEDGNNSGDENEEESEAEEEDQTPDGQFYPGKNSVEVEVEKGRGVQQQLKVWDRLLETRIQQQKLLSRVNRLPAEEYWSSLYSVADGQFTDQVKETQKSLKNLLNELLELESVLLTEHSEEPVPKRKKLAEFSEALALSHANFKSERNAIIQKWGDKTRITSAGKNSFSSLETSTVQQIDQILANPARLVERTRLKRTRYSIMGRGDEAKDENVLNETDPNIFDDDDFYHQLLRDLIDRKTNSSSDQSQLTRQWLEVQKLRTKLKKKVDTKASKGRKVRYDIHAKLVNFMAPVYERTQREDTKNELFSSLFGSRK